MTVKEFLEEHNPDAVLFDGFDEALIGTWSRFNVGPLALYDYNKCIHILINRDGMTHEEAVEYFDFNVIGAWVGEYTPAFANLEFDTAEVFECGIDGD